MSGILNLDFWVFVGILAGIYTIFGLGLQIQFGFAGLVNFGHVGFMAIGAYTMAILIIDIRLPLWIAGLGAIAATILAAMLMGLPTLRLRTDYFAIATIAFGEIIRYLATNLDGITGGSEGSVNLLGPTQSASYVEGWVTFQDKVESILARVLGDFATRNATMLVSVWVVAIGLILITLYAFASPWGRILRGIREDQDAVSALGKNTVSYELQALAAGAGMAAISGMFYAFQYSVFGPMDFEPLITFFAYVIIIMGGIGSFWGVPIGSLIFAFIFAGSRFLSVPPFSYLDASGQASLRMILIGLIIILLMAFRPEGILGKREELALHE